MTMPRAIIFDWDNTLIDSWGCILAAYNQTFRHFAMPEWTLDEVKSKVGHSMRDSFPRMFGDRWVEAGEIYGQAYADVHIRALTPLPDMGTMLARLGDLGVYLAVVSNKRGRFLRAEADALGWNDHFGALLGSGDAPADKPAADPVHVALAPAGIAAGPDVWFAGDSLVDLQCAVASGCVPTLLRAEPAQPGEFGPTPPAQHFPTARSLLSRIDELSVSKPSIWC